MSFRWSAAYLAGIVIAAIGVGWAANEVFAATAVAGKNRLTATCSSYSPTTLRCVVWIDYTAARATRARVWVDGTYLNAAGPRWQTRSVRLERGRNELAIRFTVRRFDYRYAWSAAAGPSVTQAAALVDGSAVGFRIHGEEQFDPLAVRPTTVR